MYSKEQFKEMSDKDILDKYSRFDCFYYEEQLLMLDELRERKHITQEERDNLYEKTKILLEKRNEENRKYQKSEKKDSSKQFKLYYILIVFVYLNHTNITHLIAIGFDMIGFHKAYVFMLKTTYALDFREKSALPTKLLADDYFWEKDYKNARKYYSHAHAFARHKNEHTKAKNDTELTALAGDALSSLYLGDYSRFEGDEWQIIEFAEENKDKIKGITTYESVYYFYRDVSGFYEGKKDYPNALKYMEKARKYSSGYSIFELYKLTGDLYFKSNDYEKAREFYKKAFDFNSKKEGLDEWDTNLMKKNKKKIEENLTQMSDK